MTSLPSVFPPLSALRRTLALIAALSVSGVLAAEGDAATSTPASAESEGAPVAKTKPAADGEKKPVTDEEELLREKTASEATASEKTASEKTASEKTASEKTASEKTASEKTASEATASEKTASEKTASEATASEKTASEKTASEATASEATASEATASEATASEATAPEETASETPADTVESVPEVPATAAATAIAEVAPAPKPSRAAWAGSSIGFRNVASAVSLDRGALLTYDPYYAMSLSIDPRWAFTEAIYVRGHLDFSRELTRSNWTTQGRQYIAGDLVFAGGMSPVYKLPVVGVAIGAELGVRIPTSLASQGSTLQLGIEPTLRLSRAFPVLEGLSVGYSAAPWIALHRYTTGSLASPLIPCAVGSVECARFSNAGDRNAPWGHSHSLSAGLQILPWFGVSASAGVHLSVLYPVASDERVKYVATEPQDVRYANSFGLGASFQPTPSLEIGVGASSFNPQQAPDSTYYGFAFNRFTNFFVDLRFQPGALWAQLRGTPAGASPQ